MASGNSVISSSMHFANHDLNNEYWCVGRHTGVVVYGIEYFFGGGVQALPPHVVVQQFGIQPVQVPPAAATTIAFPLLLNCWVLSVSISFLSKSKWATPTSQRPHSSHTWRASGRFAVQYRAVHNPHSAWMWHLYTAHGLQ